jgi:hypothetical protein
MMDAGSLSGSNFRLVLSWALGLEPTVMNGRHRISVVNGRRQAGSWDARD